MSDRVRIYSGQHGAYWRPDGHGYTNNPEEAWTICREDAERATSHCGPEKQIELWPVPDGWMTRDEMESELTRLRAENALIRAALKPILARIEMPAGGFSRTQDVMIQASELVALQTALAGEDSNG